jgi:hypothetical protein
VHQLVTHKVEPFTQARFLIKAARKIAIHAIDDGGKLQEKRARDKISAGEKPPRQNADKRRYDRNLVGRKWSKDKNFRQVAAEWAIKKSIDDSIRTAGKRCPKAALGLAHRNGVSNWCGDFPCAHRRVATRRHRNRQTNVISQKQLPSTFDYLLKIRSLDQHTSVDEERRFVEFWYC